jgi:hypothetical protein
MPAQREWSTMDSIGLHFSLGLVAGTFLMSTVAGDSPEQRQKQVADRPTRWSRAAIPLLLAGIAALAWAICPAQWAAWATVIAVAWIAAYRVGCDNIGGLLWGLAAGLASGPICIVTAHGTFDDFARLSPVTVATFPLLIAAGLRLLWTVRKKSPNRGPNAAMIVVAVFTLIIPSLVSSMISRSRQYEEQYEESTQMFLGLHQVGRDVEAFHKARGRLPSEAELVEWRGSPMPSWGSYGNIRLYVLQSGEYQLQSSTHGFWGYAYDWAPYIVVYTGARSPERIHIESF